jgi:beta-galactosidase GanA
MRHRAMWLIAILLVASNALSQSQHPSKPMPRLEHRDGRHALIVDGAPYLVLGAQVGNSSAWPAMLPKVWPAIEQLHANTIEIPIYWEQFEPAPGRFDTSLVDLILRQAADHHVRVVLLWFGTWKNGSGHYMPLWLKERPERYPHVVAKDGRTVDSPSPHALALREADARAFRALMRHLKNVDLARTVIMVQVENEPGTWGSIRDYSPEAERLFRAPVPATLTSALGVARTGSWPEVFGDDADEFFHAWSVASFVGAVAEAGKAEYPLPLYVNAALRDPLVPPRAGSYESGGATDNVLGIWKAAAPAVDILAPDIYQDDPRRYRRVLELYARPDNPLFVPETSHTPETARMFFPALGRGAIGWAPFGVDFTAYDAARLGEPRLTEAALAPFALNYRLLEPIMREVARLNADGALKAVAEERDEHVQTLDFERWTAVVSYGSPTFGPDRPNGNPEPIGRAVVARLGDDEFLVAGVFCRVDFRVTDTARQREFLRVEEGSYVHGEFRPVRIWNGDQTDWGLNFTSAPEVLRVRLATF